MFDIGFLELLLIGVIALLVIGPNRLPSVAKKTGRIMGKLNHLASKFKDDISRELKADDLKETLAKQKESLGIHEIVDDINETKQSVMKARNTLLKDADPAEIAKLDSDSEQSARKKYRE